MKRFTTPNRLSIILVVALACGMVATFGMLSAGWTTESSAPAGESLLGSTPDLNGIEVDINRLTFVSNVS